MLFILCELLYILTWKSIRGISVGECYLFCVSCYIY